MSKTPTRSGLKRQVSPKIAILVITAVIALALFVGLGVPLLTKPSIDPLVRSLPKGALKTMASERLGVTLSPVADYQNDINGKLTGSGGLPITGVTPPDAGLQVGDILISVNGQKTTTDFLELYKITESVKVGEKMALGIRRNGKDLTVDIPRRTSQAIAPNPNGGGPAPGAFRTK